MSDPFQRLLPDLLRNLHSMAVRIRRSSAREASDLVQETVTRALPDLLAGRPRNLRAFLATVMHNVAISDGRRDRRRRRALDIDVHDFDPPAAEPRLDLDLVEDLRHALSQLEDFERAVIQACFFEDLTQTEAAARLSCTRRSVREALDRARHSLKALLIS